MLYIGIVEDRKDPLQLGRVKVRVFGLHTDDKTQIPTDDLPWAQVMQNITSAANSGVGDTPLGMVEGTTVILMYTDPNDMQQPIIIGTLSGNIKEHYKTLNGIDVGRNKEMGFNDPSGTYPKEEYINESDVNKLARDKTDKEHSLIQERKDNRDTSIDSGPVSWDEPEVLIGKHEYPYNKVMETESGHIIEIDDTPNNERIHIKHKDGSFIEMRPGGDILTKSKDNSYEIIASDKDVYVKGNVNLTINSDCNTKILGDYNLDVNGDININAGGRTNHESRGTHTIISPKIDLNP